MVKSAAFTKVSRAITLAVREGGGMTDPNNNFHLRLAIEKARAANMPKENIARVIEKAAGGAGSDVESAMYEAYAPYGIALLISVATDNKNRAVSFIKQTLEHSGGTLVSPGAASYIFTRKENAVVPTQTIPLEEAQKQQVFDIIHRLEALEDVQTVYSNVE